ncbi:uncharacterized protein [Palaemon carinicauda]|uniref:uncharacterized protein n=1 Tax=Palaemon carinicauda TaxID=392227 RepID=UPI0035B5E80B
MSDCHSLLPRPLASTRRRLSKSANVCLVADNGSTIPTHGYENLALTFLSIKYYWKFLIVDIPLPILVSDFLSHYHLLVNVAHRRLVNAESYFLTLLQPAPSNLTLHISAPMDVYVHPFTLYPEIFCPELRQKPTVPTEYGIYHHNKTTRPQVFTRFRYLATAKEMFPKMKKMGLCQKASSPWSSLLHINLKIDGFLHLSTNDSYIAIRAVLEQLVVGLPDHWPFSVEKCP